jgi:glycosyltransferase involved in cell wall biosynthesis
LRIVQFIDSLHAGGAERMAVNISNILVENGHDVMLLVSRNAGPLLKKVSPCVKVNILEKKSFWDFSAFISFVKILKEFKPDVVHAHSTSVYWAVVSKSVIKSKWQTIFHDHNGMRAKFSKYRNMPLILISPYIDKVIVVNATLKSWADKQLSVNQKNILFLNNFPYLNPLQKHINNQSIKIVSLANLRPVKDHVTLLKSFSILVNEYKPQHIKLVLAGNTYNDAYQHEIETLIASSGLHERVEIRGEVDDVETLLADADIGVLSSYSEGLPVSLLEYGLAGLPVVVTNVGQCAEVVGNGTCGKIVEPHDARALASALKEYMEAPEKAQKMGMLFKKHVQENYGSAMFLKSYMHLLNS